jgi:hypothetical protein
MYELLFYIRQCLLRAYIISLCMDLLEQLIQHIYILISGL